MSEFTFFELPEDVVVLFGKRSLNGRRYVVTGGTSSFGKWCDDLGKHVGPTLTPGDVSLYLGIAVPSVHERMSKGKVSSFCFEFSDSRRVTKVIKIPLSECVAWREQRNEKISDAHKQELREAEDRADALQKELDRMHEQARQRRLAKLLKLARKQAEEGYCEHYECDPPGEDDDGARLVEEHAQEIYKRMLIEGEQPEEEE